MNISAKNSLSIRQFYNENKVLVPKANRADATIGKLADADSLALRRAVRKLGDFKYEDASSDSLYEKIRALADTYNYTLESGTKYGANNHSVKRAVKDMKVLSEKYASELKGYGINFDEDGYMSVTSTSVSNVDHSSFEEIFGKESEYMTTLSAYAKKFNRHVDIYI
ncbi:MAG: hypothetical protein HUJ71_03640 [Pseudobutyrivibrio sp.]|nr:hypothetical protein [Pseudobutyrivibrio sp.]